MGHLNTPAQSLPPRLNGCRFPTHLRDLIADAHLCAGGPPGTAASGTDIFGFLILLPLPTHREQARDITTLQDGADGRPQSRFLAALLLAWPHWWGHGVHRLLGTPQTRLQVVLL